MDTDTTNIRQFKKKNDKKDVLFDEFNKKRAGREVNKMMWIALGIVAFVVLAAASFIGARLYFTNKAYTSVSVVDSTEVFISTGSVVKRFGNYFVIYNSDGIKCIDYKGEQIWNEAFQMQKPLTDISEGGFFNYHPKYVENIFKEAGFKREKVLSVSNFRSKGMKKVFRTKNLVRMENVAQKALAPIRFAPSIYYKLRKPEE